MLPPFYGDTEMSKAYIIDSETTSAKHPHTIEVAFVEFAARGALVGAPTVLRFNPPVPIEFGAMAAHHILPDELEGMPEYSPLVFPMMDYVIGHNIDFDADCCQIPGAVKRVCTLAMARAIWPNTSHTQSALLYMLSNDRAATRERLRNAHSAGADVIFCYEILLAILSERPHIRTIEELYAFSEECRIPKVMTFGKFSGMPVQHVETGWRNWYRRQTDKDPYLLRAFELYPYDPMYKE